MYDVAIVGAGPAGSAAATILSKKGYNTIILEKKKLPREKVCGGAVSVQCTNLLKKLGVTIDKVSLQRYDGFCVNYGDIKAKCDIGTKMGWGVYRKDFDYLLLTNAQKSGATVYNREVTGFEDKGKYVKIFTNKGVIKAKLLLGADGVRSIIRKKLDIDYDKTKLGFCLETEVKTSPSRMDQFNNMLELDFSYFKEGYAWAFPKKDGGTVNIGIGGYLDAVQDDKTKIKELLYQYIKDLNITQDMESINVKGALLPFGGSVDIFGKGNAILLGDAAGLVSPLSGEGIAYALESGIIAANCSINFFEKKTSLVENYTKSISHLAKEINDYALTLQKKVYGSNFRRKLFVKMCANNTELMNMVGKIFIHIIPYETGVKKLSIIKLLPTAISSLMPNKELSPIKIEYHKPLAKWVRI